MEKFLIRSASSSNLSNKRDREEGFDDWQLAKRTATLKEISARPSVPTTNRFRSLNVDNISQLPEPQRAAMQPRSNPKRVPPIIIQMNDNWTHGSIKSAIDKLAKNFHLQYRGKNRVSIQCYSPEAHQKIKEGLQLEKVAFHTFTRKDEKMSKVVIKGLPAYFEETLVEELSLIGFKETTVTKLSSPLKPVQTCPPFLVQLPAGTDITKFRQIRYIGNCAVQICRFKANSSLGTQCFRCQNFGHASRNCYLPPRCVKCPEPHASKDCPKKDRDSPARCCNCNEDHAASYSKCPERQKYLKRLKEKSRIQDEPQKPQRGQPLDNMTIPMPAAAVSSWANLAKGARPSEQPIRSSERTPPEPHADQDSTTKQMLEILGVIKTIRGQFSECNTMFDKVILILTHLGHYI